MAGLLYPDDQQQPSGPQGLLATAAGDWRDTIAPQPTQADAADATAKAYSDFLARDRAEQVRLGYVDPQTGERTPEGWKQQAQVIGGGFGPADIGMVTGLLGSIKAYHGSPHAFERFDMSKIGTGEGAQAYGHGLYFAENEGVARGYRDTLTKTDAPLYQGSPIGRGDEAYGVGSWMNAPMKQGETMADYLARRAADVEAHGKFMSRSNSRQDQEAAGMYFDAAKKLKAANPADWSFPTGHMYEVNLNAEPEQMLHWDKRVIDQPTIMAKLPEDIRQELLAAGEKSKADWGDYGVGTKATDYATGQELHRMLSTKLGGDAAAATALREAGIPGISYLDAGSRGGGKGTSNFVMFDDAFIKILRKYGIIGTAGGGAAAAASGQQDQNQ